MGAAALRQGRFQLQRRVGAGCLAVLSLALAPSTGWAQTQTKRPTAAAQASPVAQQPLRATYDAYILGPGDALEVELQDIPEYSGVFAIGPDGTMYLPRLRGLYVEGLTVEELRYFLTQQFNTYVRNPQVYVRPVAYRPIRVYVGGEVRRPGYYYLAGEQTLDDADSSAALAASNLSSTQATRLGALANPTALVRPQVGTRPIRLPTVFDAIRAGQGVTPFSDLASVSVTRRQPLSAGGGKIRTTLDFLSLITEGDESQNIRLFDGDMVVVAKSPVALREQILQAAETNLSPELIEVFVSGRVKNTTITGAQGRGAVQLPQGSSLNQAITAAGGPKLLRGSVEFLRFNRDGSTDRRQFGYDAGAAAGSQKNPVLMTGDVIRINDSVLSASLEVLNEVTGPVLTLYSLYRFFQP
ncbi:MAG: polysaccharide export protein [Cyanobacteria bacterium K_Offshore_0m_m2_072]|nr:polysaccharide export protein [Cyanobacteria bacterium K_Offshore_0m_m2_072]